MRQARLAPGGRGPRGGGLQSICGEFPQPPVRACAPQAYDPLKHRHVGALDPEDNVEGESAEHGPAQIRIEYRESLGRGGDEVNQTIQLVQKANAGADVSLRVPGSGLAGVLDSRTQISKSVMAGTVARSVAERNARLEEWQERWDQLSDTIDAIVAERGEDMLEVPGGSTGFLARIVKPLPGSRASGELGALEALASAADVAVRYEYRIDSGLLRMINQLLELGKRAAQELGQWNEKYVPAADEDQLDMSNLTDGEVDTMNRLFAKAGGKKYPSIH